MKPMYIKWIVCDVKENFRDEFSLAQEKWKAIKNINGFKGQAGGWNLEKTSEACIISFWKDKKSLTYFMEYIHDDIFHDNKQDKTFQSIRIKYFDSKFDLLGRAKDLTETLENAEILRIAESLVIPENSEHFEEVQQLLWIPEMRKAKGMLGGVFSLAEKESNRYLVSTFWDNLEDHQTYARDKVPILREKAGVANDLITMDGKEILLVNTWKVLK